MAVITLISLFSESVTTIIFYCTNIIMISIAQIIRGKTRFDGEGRVRTVDLDPRAPSWRLSGFGSTIDDHPGPPGRVRWSISSSVSRCLSGHIQTRRGYAEAIKRITLQKVCYFVSVRPLIRRQPLQQQPVSALLQPRPSSQHLLTAGTPSLH